MGHRLIRWFGDPSPWSDPTIARALAQGRVPLNLVEKLRFFDKWQRQIARGSRVLGLESGFGQSYQFGPQQFLVWMTDEDAAHLFRNRWERWQFLDVTETPWMTVRPPMLKDQWHMLLADFAELGPGRRAGTRLSAQQALRDAEQYRRVERSRHPAAAQERALISR